MEKSENNMEVHQDSATLILCSQKVSSDTSGMTILVRSLKKYLYKGNGSFLEN